jgi:hypothetical protein
VTSQSVYSALLVTLSIHAIGVLLVPPYSSYYTYVVGNRAMLSHLTHGLSNRLFYLTMVTAIARAMAMTAVCLSTTARMTFTHTYKTIYRCK